jgi:hypothetical protein
MLNQSALIQFLQLPANTGLSDADAAAGASAPIYTPRTTPVTITTLAGYDSWGFAKATAALAAFQAVANTGGANGAQAALLIAILTGPGLLASDPQVATLANSFVAMSGGALVDSDVPLALNTASYLAGQIVQASDVTAARAQMAFAASIIPLQNQIISFYNSAITAVQGFTAGQTVPTFSQLVTQYGPKS